MDQLEEIKSKIDIVDFISGYLPLKKTGRNFKALCPFHSEKTPSFIVSPEKQIWHCFGCGAGGDIFGFLMKIENLDFSEALQVLGQRAGVVLKRYKPELKERRNRIFEINRLTALFYHKILKESPKAKRVLDYLIKQRQLSQKIIDKFQLGYAPNTKDVLYRFLRKKGFSDLEIQDSGVVKERDGEIFDLFYNRIIFPFADTLGRITGFTARSLNERDMPKYLNTPQTLVFDKSKTLYRIDLAKDAIKKQEAVILVEGQMDVLASAKVGVENVICSSGTALTLSQIDLIKKYTPNMILAFDMDLAGESATRRGIEEALEQGLNIKVAILPYGKDPDECIRKDPKLWEEAIKNALYFVDFYFQLVSDKLKVSPHSSIESGSLEEKKYIAYQILPILAKIPDKIEQAHFISKLSSKLQLPEKFLSDALVSFGKKESGVELVDEIPLQDQSSIVEERLLSLILVYPESLEHFITQLEANYFNSRTLRDIYKKVQGLYTREGKFSLKRLQKSLKPEEVEKISLITLGIEEFYNDKEKREIFEEVQSYISRLRKLKFEKRKKELELAIQEAERVKDKEKVKSLIGKFQRLLKEESRAK